jgi:hypothetical protein
MNENILASLIGILQKHANAIRKLQVANIVLMESARQQAIQNGENVEEFEKRLLASLSSVEKNAPHPLPNVAKEIEETIDELNLLEQKAKELAN